MIEQGGGAIVNVASVNAFFQPDAGTVDYGAGQGGARQPQQVAGPGVRAEGHPRQLRLPRPGRAPTCGSATTASPTPSARPPGVDADTARATSWRASAASPTGRFTTPEEVATLVVLLASRPHRATSPARTTSSTAGSSRRRDARVRGRRAVGRGARLVRRRARGDAGLAPALAAAAQNAMPSADAFQAAAVSGVTRSPDARCWPSPKNPPSQPTPTAPGPNSAQRSSSTWAMCSSSKRVRPSPLGGQAQLDPADVAAELPRRVEAVRRIAALDVPPALPSSW